MKEKKVEAIKTWAKLKSVSNIQVFLGLTNFYKKFLKNFSRIAVSYITIFQILGNNYLSPKASENKKNQNSLNSISGVGSGGVNRDIENLSNIIKLAKFKKSDLVKAKKLDFAKAYFFRTDFFTFGAKLTFIYL